MPVKYPPDPDDGKPMPNRLWREQTPGRRAWYRGMCAIKS
jgi:hypothetical protein